MTLRYDDCITVPESVTGEGELGVMDYPAGRYAVTLHEGPYSKRDESYARIFGSWLAWQPHEPGSAPCLEFYLNSPEVTQPEELLT